MDIDLVDPDQWMHGIPHEQFAWLRREAPVFGHGSNDPSVPEFWALTSHAEVQAANRDVVRFGAAKLLLNVSKMLCVRLARSA